MKYYVLSPKVGVRKVPPLVFLCSALDISSTPRIMLMNAVGNRLIQRGDAGFAGPQTLADHICGFLAAFNRGPAFFCERG